MDAPLTVSEFGKRISGAINGDPSLRNVHVVGELASFKEYSSGHAYPELKDEKDGSLLRCTFFRGRLRYLAFKPEPGMKVVVFGSANYYEKGGSLSFNIESMAPYGEGSLKKALEELAARLLAEGLFDPERKRRLPKYPRVVGVVTSESGAAIRDIIDTMAKRFPADILLAPATVQGDAAPESIVRGIAALNARGVDVMIVGRGGGSADDLSAFNDEDVVRAVAGSRAPVISAVGHATDKSLVDRAADAYAETPTAAAAMATAGLEETVSALRDLGGRAFRSVRSTLESTAQRIRVCDVALSPKRMSQNLEMKGDGLALLTGRLDAALTRSVARARDGFAAIDRKLDPNAAARTVHGHMIAVDSLAARSDAAAAKAMDAFRSSVSDASARLSNLDPMGVIGRGYCYLEDSLGKAVTSVDGLEIGRDVSIVLKDGNALAGIKEKVKRDG
ncbi:MAG: exodeoxyribonuclease VII large subunit [Thermoplasmatales archaeon]|nr:exodeoxyribonuclease VII large subunit [Thermoplasmatales archaeon]